MISKKIFIPVIALTIAGTTFFGVSQFVHAQNSGQTLVQMIAQKFGLDQNKVQAVFDDYKNQHQSEKLQFMQDRLKTHLDGLVSQGKITSSQEQAIIDELSKLRDEVTGANFKNMTSQERKQAMQKIHDEFVSWAKSQGIDLTLVHPFGGIGMHKGWGHGWMMQ
jgi:hypothetical protein